MVKPTVIARRKAKQSIAVHCQKLDCHGSLRNLAMTAKMPTPRHCGSLPKTGLPRFLTEPRNDSENANPSSLRTPTPPSLRGGTPKQSSVVHYRRLDCPGSLRNLAMTAKMPTPPSLRTPLLVIARRHAEAIHCGSLPKTGLPRFLTEPRNDSGNANPSSLRTPLHVIASRKAKQSIAVHCQKLDCRGSFGTSQ